MSIFSEFKIFVLVSIILLGNILDDANKAANMPLQVLLIVAVLILGGVIVYQNRSREKTQERTAKETRESQDHLIKQLEDERRANDSARANTQTLLLEVVRTNTTAMNLNSEATRQNTSVLHDLPQRVKDIVKGSI